MFPLPAQSYSCNAIQSLGQFSQRSREFRTIHNDFKQVETTIDETRQAIGKEPTRKIEEKLDKLDLQLHKVHPEVTDITEEACLSPADKELLAAESNTLTDKLNILTQKLPDKKLQNKAAHLTEAQINFQALMNFEFNFGRDRNPEKDENSFNTDLRHCAKGILRATEEAQRLRAEEEKRLMAAKEFHKPGLTLKPIKPATGLAY